MSIFNIGDTVVQTFHYGGTTFDIHNRNLNSSEDNMIGYSKNIVSDLYLEVDSNHSIMSDKEKKGIHYDLEWSFIFNDEEISLFMGLMTQVLYDIQEKRKHSIHIYKPFPTNLADKQLQVEDNRIKDYLTEGYKTYSINITRIGDIETLANNIYLINFQARTV